VAYLHPGGFRLPAFFSGTADRAYTWRQLDPAGFRLAPSSVEEEYIHLFFLVNRQGKEFSTFFSKHEKARNQWAAG